MIKNLKKLRLKSGVTQKTLAAVLGVSQQSVNKYENSNVEPDLSTLIKMADYFGTSVDHLVGHTDEDDADTMLRIIDDSEETLLRFYRVLPEQQKQVLLSIVESYH